jgi:hypothetical protein
MDTDKKKEGSHAEAQRRRENKGIVFSAPLRLCVSSPLMHFICVHLIYICGNFSSARSPR